MRILKSSKKIKIWFFAVSIFFVCLGVFISVVVVQSPKTYIQVKEKFVHRKIASATVESLLDENMPYDLTGFSDSELAVRTKIRIAQRAEFSVAESEDGARETLLLLPDFQIQNRDGKNVSVCEVLPFVQVVLEADGASWNGDPVRLVVASHCRAENMEGVKDVQQGKIKIFLGLEKLKNKSEVKGLTWFVREIQLYSHGNNADRLKINSYEILKIRGQDLSVKADF